MRRYEDNFNEEYERGFRAGRREALRELNENTESINSLVEIVESIVKKYKKNLTDMSFNFSQNKITISQRNEYPTFKISIEESQLKSGHFTMDADLTNLAGSNGRDFALNTHITEQDSSTIGYIETCKDIIVYYEMLNEILQAIKN